MMCFKFAIPLPNLISRIILFTGNTALCLSCLFGNSLVLYLVWKKPTLRSPTYYLLSALALSDLLTSLFGQLSYCISVTFLSDISCTADKAIAFVNASSCTSSLLLLCLIARDRYLRVSKGLAYSDHTSVRFTIIASSFCYLNGMLIACLFIFENRIIKIASTFVFATIGTSTFTFICYKSTKIIRKVQSHIEQMRQGPPSDALENNGGEIHSYKNFENAVNRSLFSVIILFFISWTPVIILMIIFTVHTATITPINDSYRIAFAWASSVSYFNGALNPVIYSYRCDAIGREMRQILARIKGNRNAVSHEGTGTVVTT